MIDIPGLGRLRLMHCGVLGVNSCAWVRSTEPATLLTSFAGRSFKTNLGIKKKDPSEDASFLFGSGDWARTSDLVVNSDPLYH